jgi:hypothetical protein
MRWKSFLVNIRLSTRTRTLGIADAPRATISAQIGPK